MTSILTEGAITLGLFWFFNPEDNYEPLTLISLTLATIILLVPEIPYLKDKRKLDSPEEILEYREKMRKEIEQKLEPQDKYKTHGDAIIRDISRMDKYPEIDDQRKGISPWFRLEIKGLYHRGVEFFMRRLYVKYEPEYEAWRLADYKEEDTESALLVGLIPFERIKKIVWAGDENYYFPHFYCTFVGQKKEPYEELLICKEEGRGEHRFFHTISDYESAKELEKKLKEG